MDEKDVEEIKKPFVLLEIFFLHNYPLCRDAVGLNFQTSFSFAILINSFLLYRLMLPLR